ncbi:hypothetical protein LUZ62_046984 [Rhynchospora pubera]|uniref:Thaumatin-like protein n=1 Tax=Rhynchospora pubera TaxID=906938 RepID=A0AAV8FY23_9POAL|nr:hypothetical protein LUZ62_046984 [Rhynchospora pubera]
MEALLLFIAILSVATVRCESLAWSVIASNRTTFMLRNNCQYTVWPGTLSGNGAAVLGGGGFELAPHNIISFSAPPGWSGRFWARTGCSFSNNTAVGPKCATGDCGGVLNCTLGGTPPVTLAEFTLANQANEKDFYDVSLVDGYNVGIGITALNELPKGSSCGYAGCVSDVNARCPPELGLKEHNTTETIACMSACEAFQTDQYCCTGAHSVPRSCGPTKYSKLFKAACPSAYSYAYDDPTSTFTCSAGTNYLVTFCPSGATAKAAHFWPRLPGHFLHH